MRQITTAGIARPAATLDPEVVEFRSQFGETSPLDELVRTGAQRMLQTAIEAEVQEFVAVHGDRRDAGGNRLVVRNGYQPARELLTEAGRLEVQQPRVRDNSAQKEGRVRFSSSILPPYLRRSKAIDELIPWLYLTPAPHQGLRHQARQLDHDVQAARSGTAEEMATTQRTPTHRASLGRKAIRQRSHAGRRLENLKTRLSTISREVRAELVFEFLQRDVRALGDDLFDVLAVNSPPRHPSPSGCRSCLAELSALLFHPPHPGLATTEP
jgi:hypothetical protein